MFTLHAPDDLMAHTIVHCCAQNEYILDHNIAAKVSITHNKSGISLPLTFPLRMGELLDALKKIEIESNLPDKIPLSSGTFYPKKEVFEDLHKHETSLTEKECDLLLTLWRVLPSALQKDELLEQVWGYSADLETHTLETHIYRLRQKIELDPTSPQNLVTDKDGYHLILAK